MRCARHDLSFVFKIGDFFLSWSKHCVELKCNNLLLSTQFPNIFVSDPRMADFSCCFFLLYPFGLIFRQFLAKQIINIKKTQAKFHKKSKKKRFTYFVNFYCIRSLKFPALMRFVEEKIKLINRNIRKFVNKNIFS